MRPLPPGDFGPFVLGSSSQPTGWTFSSSLLGVTPPGVKPTDNPHIANLTWTCTGTTPISGEASLGIFSVVTGTNQLKLGQFAAEATRSSGGTKIDNIGSVSVPAPEMSALLPIFSVCSAGLLSLLPPFLRRCRISS